MEFLLSLPFLFCVFVYVRVYSCREGMEVSFPLLLFYLERFYSRLPPSCFKEKFMQSCIPLFSPLVALCLSFSTFSHIPNLDRWKARSILKGNPPLVLCSFFLKQPFFICRLLPQDMSRWSRGEPAFSLHVQSATFLFFQAEKPSMQRNLSANISWKRVCISLCLCGIITWIQKRHVC